VGNIFRLSTFEASFATAPGEKSVADAARTNHPHANAVFAEIFRHAAGKTEDTPFGGAIDAATSEGVFAGEGLMLMMSPEPRRIIEGATARERRKTLLRLVSRTRSQSASVFSWAGAKRPMPGVVDEDGDGA